MRKCLVLLIFLFASAATLMAVGAQEEKMAEEPETIKEILFVCHKVHQSAIEGVEGTKGKNLAAEFLTEHPNIGEIKFLTATVPDIKNRLFREAALAKTTLDLGVATSEWVSPAVENLFVSFDSYMAKAPLEEFEDIYPGLRADMTVNGRLYGIPMRTGGQILFSNNGILKERGLSGTPSTVEELVTNIYKCAYTRSGGEEVYGYVGQGEKTAVYVPVGTFIRSKDGDYITPDYKLTMTDPRVIEGVQLFRDFYANGILPPNYTAIAIADAMQLFKDNRVAFITAPPDYYNRYTTPDGLPKDQVDMMNFPAASEYKNKYPEGAPMRVFQWAFVMPKGGQHKDATWDFVRFVASKEGVKWMSINGNTPVRFSTLEDPEYAQGIPYIEQQKILFKYGRPMFPGFENWPQARDILGEELHRAILGEKSAEQAMRDAQAAIQPLLP